MSSTLRCSFCRKTEHQVAKLAAGPNVFICDECVAIADRIMQESDSPPPSSLWRPLLSGARHRLGSYGRKSFFGLAASRHAA